MHKNYYDILGIEKDASSGSVLSAYNICSKKCEDRLDKGDMSAQNELVNIKEIFRTLSDPVRREAYNSSLQSIDQNGSSLSFNEINGASGNKGIFISWWQTSKTSMLLAGLFILVISYIGLGYFKTSSNENVASEAITSSARNDADRAANEGRLIDGSIRNDAGRVSNEGRLIDGAIRNEKNLIEHKAQILNRAIGVAEDREDRYRQELEYRANAGTQILEMERREQEARLEMQRERQIQQEKQIENQRIEREKRYYTCLNGAIDMHGSARASAMCAQYR